MSVLLLHFLQIRPSVLILVLKTGVLWSVCNFSIFEDGQLLLPEIDFHLDFLVQLPDCGFCYAIRAQEGLYFVLDIV